MISEKAEWAARKIAVVDPKYTSQTCFVCVACGHRDHADVNAARNILAKAELRPQSGLSSGATTRLTQVDAA